MKRPEETWGTTRSQPVPAPAYRRLRGYALDPSASTRMDTAMVNEIVFRVEWEDDGRTLQDEPWGGRYFRSADLVADEQGLLPGPVGEYVEVVDYDPSSQCFYAPVDLNQPILLAQDGLSPAAGNPQFHQQMVYAVAMTTIHNFERALGRYALWPSTTRWSRSPRSAWSPWSPEAGLPGPSSSAAAPRSS